MDGRGFARAHGHRAEPPCSSKARGATRKRPNAGRVDRTTNQRPDYCTSTPAAAVGRRCSATRTAATHRHQPQHADEPKDAVEEEHDVDDRRREDGPLVDDSDGCGGSSNPRKQVLTGFAVMLCLMWVPLTLRSCCLPARMSTARGGGGGGGAATMTPRHAGGPARVVQVVVRHCTTLEWLGAALRWRGDLNGVSDRRPERGGHFGAMLRRPLSNGQPEY